MRGHLQGDDKENLSLQGDDKENLSPNLFHKSRVAKKGLQSSVSNNKLSGLVTPLKTVRQYDQSQEEIFLREARTPIFKVHEEVITENKYMINCPLTPNLLSYQSVGHSVLLAQLDKSINPIPNNNASIILDDSFTLDASIDNSEYDDETDEFNSILDLFNDANLIKMKKTDILDNAHSRKRRLAPLLDKLSPISEVRSSKRVLHIVALYAIVVLKVTMIFIICGIYSIISTKKANGSVTRTNIVTASVNTDYYCKQLMLLDTLHAIRDPLFVHIIPFIEPLIAPIARPIASMPKLLIPSTQDARPTASMPKLLIPSTQDARPIASMPKLLIPSTRIHSIPHNNYNDKNNKDVVLKNYRQDYALSTYVATSQSGSLQPLFKHESDERNLQEVIILVDNTPSRCRIHLIQSQKTQQQQPQLEKAATASSFKKAVTSIFRLQTTIESQLDEFNTDKIQLLEYVLIVAGIITVTV